MVTGPTSCFTCLLTTFALVAVACGDDDTGGGAGASAAPQCAAGETRATGMLGTQKVAFQGPDVVPQYVIDKTATGVSSFRITLAGAGLTNDELALTVESTPTPPVGSQVALAGGFLSQESGPGSQQYTCVTGGTFSRPSNGVYVLHATLGSVLAAGGKCGELSGDASGGYLDVCVAEP